MKLHKKSLKATQLGSGRSESNSGILTPDSMLVTTIDTASFNDVLIYNTFSYILLPKSLDLTEILAYP